MVDSIQLAVPDEALAESLKDCKIGEEKTLTFKVTAVAQGTLSGDVTAVEGYEEDAEPEKDEGYDDATDSGKVESGSDMGAMKKKMPRAIVMIGMGK